jgi:hypothetical protein
MPSLAVSTFVLAAASMAHATIMLRRSVDDLARESDVVAVATAGASHASWVGGHIVTDVALQVERTMRGVTESATVTLRLPGGIIGDVGQRVEGAATLNAGARYVVFLHRETPGRYVTVAMSQGVLPIAASSDGSVRVMPSRADGAALVDDAQTRATPAIVIPADGMPLEVFVQHLAR